MSTSLSFVSAVYATRQVLSAAFPDEFTFDPRQAETNQDISEIIGKRFMVVPINKQDEEIGILIGTITGVAILPLGLKVSVAPLRSGLQHEVQSITVAAHPDGVSMMSLNTSIKEVECQFFLL